MTKRAIVFAPHPDDETLGCGGTIAKRRSEGFDVYIVIMTDGRYAFSTVLGIESQPTPLFLKEIRRAEVRKAVGRLGVPERNLRLLDFEDGSLGRDLAEVERSVADILVELSPDEVFVTSQKDINPDHRAACRAVHRSVQKLDLESVICEYSIAQKYSRLGPLLDKALSIIKRNLLEVDISAYLPVKKSALEEYKSQTSLISTNQQRPIIQSLANYLRRKEIFEMHTVQRRNSPTQA